MIYCIIDKNLKGKIEMVRTGITKKDYLDVIECVVDAYGIPLLESQLELPDEVYHFTAFRTSVMLAYLIESGRRPELFDLWMRVTEKSVRTLSVSRKSAYTDMTLEELCISFMLMRDCIKKEWLDVLAEVTPEVHFAYTEKKQMNNIVVYGCVGMYLREKLTGISCEAHLDRVMPWVMERIDENGMYHDDDSALLYDLTTRVRLEQLLWFGYDGKWKEQIENALRKGAESTLMMQSAAYQIPYGGRSNQLLHNEALQTSLCEFAALREKSSGNIQKAEQYKRAAHLSFMTLGKYLDGPNGAKHIRNGFPRDSLFGVDDYGTFPRYMNALATFIACGYLAADDTIDEAECPCEMGGFYFETSELFGKIFINAFGQSIEYALLADYDHEPAGLGRYHARNVPAELGLSMPFVAKPKYQLSKSRIPFDVIGPRHISSGFSHLAVDVEPSRLAAISPGYIDGEGKRHLLCESERPTKARVERDERSFTLISEWQSATEYITLSEKGLELSVSLRCEGKPFWELPMLITDGEVTSELEKEKNCVSVCLDRCKYIAYGEDISVTEETVANRNGIYRIVYVPCEKIKLELKEKQKWSF